MRRRIFLLAIWAVPLLADAKQQVFDLLIKIAAALSDDDPMVFLKAVDHDMPHFHEFETNLMALTDQADIANSIEILADSGNNTQRREELDWFMQVVGKSAFHPVEQRREVVRVSLERRGKKWKIGSIEPLSFFAPPKVSQ
jgi:hypothetical protein